MLNRPRMFLAAPGALILIVALAGGALGANLLTTTGPTPESVTDPLVVDTTATWEDLDGNGVDDDCQEAVTPDAEAAAAADLAIDANGDGTISVDEAARSARTGGLNCNHGGYVSWVAEETDAVDESVEEAQEAEDEAEAAPEVCEATVVPTFAPPADAAPGAFGTYVTSIAQSDAVGGKNCNHGGAVSDAVHAAQEVAKAARDAAKAERAAARDAAKAERSADRAAAKAERDAAKAERKAAAPKPGKGNGGG